MPSEAAFTIRKAVAADSPAIYDVHVGAITKICAAVYTPEEIHAWTVNKRPDGYVQAIAENDVFVATDAGRIVGFSEFDPRDQEIRAVYVHPDLVRRGIGALLLRAAEDAARARQVTGVHLRATLNAVPFYEAWGYALERLGTVELRSGTLRCAFMKKTLAGGP